MQLPFNLTEVFNKGYLPNIDLLNTNVFTTLLHSNYGTSQTINKHMNTFSENLQNLLE